VSVLLVFFAHAGFDRIVPGGFGVTIFFFLSGFLITTLQRVEFDENRRISVRQFWLRRALRIMPPYYLVLITAVIASAPGTLSGLGVLAQLLNVTNYWAIVHNGNVGQPVGTGIFWSLAVEEHFYLVFPWLYIGLRRLNVSGQRQALLFWALCVVVLLWRCVLVLHYHVPTDRTYLGTDTRIDSILFGCALAVWRNPVIDRPRLNAKAWRFGLLPAAGAALLFCLVYRNAAFRETLRAGRGPDLRFCRSHPL
jgi:peptidoglycan/LPS O-acetylase OafA/YrhL